MKLDLSLAQKQILSQRMQLSVKLLQMNTAELDEYLHKSALENPLIEIEAAEESGDEKQTRIKKLEWLEMVDDNNSFRYSTFQNNSDNNVPLYEKRMGLNLSDELMLQLSSQHLPNNLESVVKYLIGELDENGYLQTPFEKLAEALNIDSSTLSAAINVLKKMEPCGVGAKDLRECLLIQAKRMEPVSPVLINLIESHLDLVAKNQLSKIAKLMHVSIEEVKQAQIKLLSLNPKPGNGYSSYNSIPYIRPDLFVVKFEDGFQVILNDFGEPLIQINSYYSNLAGETDEKTAAYISEKRKQAEWIISSISQRKSTILNCARSILERQRLFFEKGPGNLIAMTLADVAFDLDMHPSTISRAVSGKYLQCQWGVFGLSELFSRNIGETSETSQDMAHEQIKNIIGSEDSASPLSDMQISEILEERGIKISRRTVAKYREQMQIPPGSGRKKF